MIIIVGLQQNVDYEISLQGLKQSFPNEKIYYFPSDIIKPPRGSDVRLIIVGHVTPQAIGSDWIRYEPEAFAEALLERKLPVGMLKNILLIGCAAAITDSSEAMQTSFTERVAKALAIKSLAPVSIKAIGDDIIDGKGHFIDSRISYSERTHWTFKAITEGTEDAREYHKIKQEIQSKKERVLALEAEISQLQKSKPNAAGSVEPAPEQDSNPIDAEIDLQKIEQLEQEIGQLDYEQRILRKSLGELFDRNVLICSDNLDAMYDKFATTLTVHVNKDNRLVSQIVLPQEQITLASIIVKQKLPVRVETEAAAEAAAEATEQSEKSSRCC
jgi:hypothetical protein